MTKNELIATVASRVEMPKKHVNKVYNEIFNAIKEELANHNRFQILQFGTFYTQPRKGQTVTMPNSGKTIEVPAMNVVKFRPSTELKNLVR